MDVYFGVMMDVLCMVDMVDMLDMLNKLSMFDMLDVLSVMLNGMTRDLLRGILL